MPYDLSVLSRMQQRVRQAGTSAFIETYNRDTGIVVDSFELTNYTSAADTSVVTQIMKSRLSAIAGANAHGNGATDYIVTPQNWDYGWRAALANRGSTPAILATVGDSLTQGLLASDMDNTNWVSLLRAAAQGLYGDGGSGFKASSHSVLGINSAAYTSSMVQASLWQTTGTWVQNLTNPEGPGGSVLQAQSAGATLTCSRIRGTQIEFFFLRGNSASFGSWSYNIDGAGWVSAGSTNTGAQGIGKVTVTGLSAGTHTVQVRADDASGTVFFFFCGARGSNGSGVRVDNYGRGSYISQAFNNDTGTSFTTTGGQTFGGASNGNFGTAGKWSGGSLNTAHGVIYGMGLNDSRFASPATTPQTYFTNVQKYLEDARTGNPDLSIMIVMMHRGNPSFEATTKYYAQYVEQGRALARVFGAAFVDLWRAGQNSYTWMQTRGYWGDNTAAGAAGSDLVHFSDAGERWASGIITPLWTQA